jgi:hypothetical protein
VKEIAATEGLKNIDVSTLNTGIYMVAIKMADGSIAIRKLAIKK